MFSALGAVWAHLDAINALEGPISCLIHGGAKGADALGASWAVCNQVPLMLFAANLSIYGKSAGPIRNCDMLTRSKPDLVLAFPVGESKGTRHMMGIARDAGVEVREIEI